MKVDFSNLFVHLGGGVTETLLPITAIKAMECEGNRVKLYLKEDYCWKDYPYRMIDGMTLKGVQDEINKTIITALKEIEEEE